MLDRTIMFGLGGALLFGGLTAAALAAGWFMAIMAAVILLCAALYCVAAIAEANAETEPRPIADDVRRVKIKEKPWVRKYYNGEFDPEDDEEETNGEEGPANGFISSGTLTEHLNYDVSSRN